LQAFERNSASTRMAVNNRRHSQQHRRLTGGLGANCRRADKGKAPGPLSPTLASRYVFSLRLYETNSSERIAPAAVRRNRWAFFIPPTGLVSAIFVLSNKKLPPGAQPGGRSASRGITCSLNRNRKSGGSSSDSSCAVWIVMVSPSATPMCRQRSGRSVRNQTLRIKNHFGSLQSAAATGALVGAMVTLCLI
jgi:hypothetical protein